MDQAHHLRELIKKSKENQEAFRLDARFICVTSGKGGVGKSNLTLNLAIKLAELNKRVLVIDGDLGLSNIEVLLGIVPEYNLYHILKEGLDMEKAIIKVEGVDIISGGSGVLEILNLDDKTLQALIKSFELFNTKYDYVLIDTGAGIDNTVMSFVSACKEVVVLATPDPTSITDAYALIKNVDFIDKNMYLVINMADSIADGKAVFSKIETVCNKFLKLNIENLGIIPNDLNVVRAVRAQKPLVKMYPNTVSSKAIGLIANNIAHGDLKLPEESRFVYFMNKLFKNG